jgi:hypothetical protein
VWIQIKLISLWGFQMLREAGLWGEMKKSETDEMISFLFCPLNEKQEKGIAKNHQQLSSACGNRKIFCYQKSGRAGYESHNGHAQSSPRVEKSQYAYTMHFFGLITNIRVADLNEPCLGSTSP